MDNKGPQITWVEQPQTIKDELEEELFFIRLNLGCIKKEEQEKPYFQELVLRKKEIEMKLKLIELEKDF